MTSAHQHSSTSTRRHVTTLHLTLDLPLRDHQLRQFRGAMAELAGWENRHFHNHIDRKRTTQQASLIQYRTVGGRASIFGIGEGVEQVRHLLRKTGQQFTMGGRSYTLRVRDLHERDLRIRTTPQPQKYHISRYIPLNKANFEEWKQTEHLADRIALIERTLTGHLLGVCETLGYHVGDRLQVRISDLRHTHTVRCFGAPHIAFDLAYTVNLNLPDHIAIGKGGTLGFGIQERYKERATRKSKLRVSELRVAS